ncbi:hypothetical protein [Octadecabacter sp. R77987]
MRRFIILLCLIALASCSPPVCETRDGGIGGTGGCAAPAAAETVL